MIEIDGAQHKAKENVEADRKRDIELRKLGITVLRYSNYDINYNFYNVCENILKHLDLQANALK